MKCFNWKNYQPLYKDENRKKSCIITDLYITKQNHAIETFLSQYENEIEYVNNYYSLKVAAPCG
jgi:alpha-amylase/alpha-mannosidase (GH57 family)